jgi:hypothetical protein
VSSDESSLFAEKSNKGKQKHKIKNSWVASHAALV